MTKSSSTSSLPRHVVAWFVALGVFAFFEWRHTGFVSYALPFPVLVGIPGALLLVDALRKRYGAK